MPRARTKAIVHCGPSASAINPWLSVILPLALSIAVTVPVPFAMVPTPVSEPRAMFPMSSVVGSDGEVLSFTDIAAGAIAGAAAEKLVDAAMRWVDGAVRS